MYLLSTFCIWELSKKNPRRKALEGCDGGSVIDTMIIYFCGGEIKKKSPCFDAEARVNNMYPNFYHNKLLYQNVQEKNSSNYG